MCGADTVAFSTLHPISGDLLIKCQIVWYNYSRAVVLGLGNTRVDNHISLMPLAGFEPATSAVANAVSCPLDHRGINNHSSNRRGNFRTMPKPNERYIMKDGLVVDAETAERLSDLYPRLRNRQAMRP